MDEAGIKKEYKKEIISISELKEGITNTSFLINNEEVIRLGNKTSDPFYSALVEQKVINLLNEKDFSENVTYFNPLTKTKISTYIPNTTRLKNKASNGQIKLVADTLFKLHKMNLLVDKTFDPFSRIEFYKKQVKEPLNEEKEFDIINKAKIIYLNSPICLCHNDLVKGNLLFDKNKLILIDYEYACDNSIYFDLASFLNENNIYSKAKIIKFLHRYFKNKFDLIELNRIFIFMGIHSILWYYWALYTYQSNHQDIFLMIAKQKKASFQKDLDNIYKI